MTSRFTMAPPGWASATLGDVTSDIIDQGGAEGEPFTYIDISSIDSTSKRIVAPKTLDRRRAPSRARQRVRAGDVLVSMTRPNLNAVAIVPDGLLFTVASTGFHVLRACSVEPRWLFYLVQTPRFVRGMSALVLGVLYPAIRPRDIRSFSIALPPHAEQHRIVAEIEKHLTRLDAAVAALERVRARLKQYRASVLKAACEGRLVPTETELARTEGRDYEPASVLLDRILRERRARWEAVQLAKMKAGKVPKDDRWKAKYKDPEPPDTTALPTLPEGWTWARSGALFCFVTSGSRSWARYYAESGPLFLRIGNLARGTVRLDLEDVHHVRPPEGSEGTRTRVLENDILVSITADLGMVALAPANIGEAYVNQHVAIARLLEPAYAPFVAWFLAGGANMQWERLRRGAVKEGLGLDDIRAVDLPLPPVGEQRRIVAEIDRRFSVIEEIDATVETNLRRAERLRQAILRLAFEGELVPQDPKDEPALVLLGRIRAERARTSESRPRGRIGRRRQPPEQLALPEEG